MFTLPVFRLAEITEKISNTIFHISSRYQTRLISSVNMTSGKVSEKWKTEKNIIMQLPIDEKRKLYTIKDHIILDKVNPWDKYLILNKHVESKKHTLEDLEEFKKIKINPNMNKDLSEKINAIVNAANSRLKAGGGVDGAIHRAAGPLLQDECNTLDGCPTGEARITGGYNLPAKYVIHTVGPQDGSPAMLQSCYEKCFALQNENKLSSIAFPCISTGIYGFPNRLAAHIALQTARKQLETTQYLERVIFCTFLDIDVEIYETLMQMYFPVHNWNYSDGASVTE